MVQLTLSLDAELALLDPGRRTTDVPAAIDGCRGWGTCAENVGWSLDKSTALRRKALGDAA
jgi:hypothetical protein